MGMTGRVKRMERRKGPAEAMWVYESFGEYTFEGKKYTREELETLAEMRRERLLIWNKTSMFKALGFDNKEEAEEWERKKYAMIHPHAAEMEKGKEEDPSVEN